MALVIPIVILLLTTAIFAIYCFKKRADRAEEISRQLVYRRPDCGAQDSTPGKTVILFSWCIEKYEYTLTSYLGIKYAIKQNPSIAQKSSQKYQKSRNDTLDGINEEGSYTNSGNFSQSRGQSNENFDDETYNNSSIGYNNSTIGYNNTQPSMGYSNDGQSTSYLSHN